MSVLPLIIGKGAWSKTWPITKKILISNCDLLDAHPELYDETSYEMQSDVDPAVFEQFLSYFRTKQLPEITKENVPSFSLLGAEFVTADLEEICSLFLSALGFGKSDEGRRMARLEEDQARQFHCHEDLRRQLEKLELAFEGRLSVIFRSEQLYRRGQEFVLPARHGLEKCRSGPPPLEGVCAVGAFGRGG
jgi:hypothetical protein